MHSHTRFAVATALTLITAAPAAAVQHVVTLAGLDGGLAADQRYEFANGFLENHYGLTTAVGNNSSYLPPLERAVVETRTPATGRTRGFHVPTAASGLPVADGGTGVTAALTNFGSLNRAAPQPAGEISAPWVDDQAVSFTLQRTGTTLSYTLGSDVWTHAAASIADINALQFRLRAAGSNTISLTNVQLTQGLVVTNLGCSGATCGTGLTGAFSATSGDVHISLFDGISGDFTLTGTWLVDLSPARATSNAQIKLLSVPTPPAVPEPASWAMLIAGFGLVGTGLRHRRAALA